MANQIPDRNGSGTVKYMAVIKRLDNTEILESATQIVKSAQKSVKATMLAKEEIQNPLPKAYFSLLKKKMGSGVLVHRVGFGTTHEFRKIKKSVEIKSKHYAFHLVPKSGYRRMLLVDDSKLMFVKTLQGKKYFYFTKDREKVRSYRKYFDRIIRRG